MLQDPKLSPEFQAVSEPGEKILWTGRPVFWPFVLHAVPIVIFGMIWGLMDLGILGKAATASRGQTDLFLYAFAFLHAFPAWGSLLYAVYLVMAHGNTVYAYTNRRLLMRSGVVGTSFKSVDYDRIQELDVNVGVIDRLFGTGAVRAYCGRNTSKGARIYDQFVSIANPYDIFRAIKGVEVDVKTDWNYPNAMRPAVNPGYNTDYKPSA
jgi:membrane protein YdbS with pleckstrin-like domain